MSMNESTQRWFVSCLLGRRWKWMARRWLRKGVRDGMITLDEARELLKEWEQTASERKRRAIEAREL